ncbi:MAG: recombinase-like helix-turn-helix domain-containing protein [Rhizobiaceae bacterium]
MPDSHDWMTPRSARNEIYPLDIQSRGRELSPDEQAFADALEAIFKEGTHDMDAVAEALAAGGIKAPGSGKVDWSQDILLSELKAINASLDAAFEENGYGA